jgi:hypothetical protein
VINFATPAVRADRRRTQIEDLPRGGGFQPLVEVVEQREMAHPDLDDAARVREGRPGLPR